MQSEIGGGRTQETAAWLLRNMQDRQVQSFVYPTGTGGHKIAAAAVSQWKARSPEGVAIVISFVGQLAEQWERDGMKAITRIKASREMKRDGTVLGYAPDQIGFVIVDGPDYDPGGHLSALLTALSGATILRMLAG